jgi:threonyl-tRNA synthetase
MVIAGKKEMEKRSVTVRMRDGSEMKDITVQDLISRIKEDNTLRR